jgi:hypothetical protein
MSTGTSAPDYRREIDVLENAKSATNDNVLHTPYSTGLSKAKAPSQAPNRDEMAASDDLVNAKIEAAEARTDTKIARLEGKLDLVLSKLDDQKDDGRHTRNNVILVGVSLALLIIGSVAIAPVIFDLGSKFRETVTKEVQEQVQHTR